MEPAKGADCGTDLSVSSSVSVPGCLCPILGKNVGLFEEEVEPESGLQSDTQTVRPSMCAVSSVCLCLQEFQCLNNALRFLKG